MTNLKDVKIVDNFLSDNDYSKLYDIFWGGDLRWKINTINSHDPKKNFHIQITSSQDHGWSELYWAAEKVAEKIGLPVESLSRIRAAIIPSICEKTVNAPHIDSPLRHIAVILYMSDSKAETIIYEKYHGKPEASANMLKIEPRKNRVVAFDGFHYHSSTSPDCEPLRGMINFNFVI